MGLIYYKEEHDMKAVCLITGGGGLLGNAFCREFASAFHIMAVYHRKLPEADSPFCRRMEGPDNGACHPIIHCIQGDLNKREDIRRIVEVTLARYDRIDHIIHAAADTRFHGQLRELWQATDYPQSQLYLNSIAPMLLNSAVYDACWKDHSDENALRRRSILHVSSLSGLYVHSPAGQAFYSASKAALNILSMHLALELAPYSVRVNSICPGKFGKDEYLGKILTTIQRLIEDDSITGETITDFTT
jgi:NAD(P)-dependent dehydrogenase (short-subunit alcohol dehydrogenase family)